MKKIIMFPIFIASVVLIILGIIWINAYNGEVTRNNLIEKNRGDVHAALGSRYDKVLAFIDAIEGADTTVTNYLNIIKEARTAFAEAIDNGDIIEADAEAGTIDSTFVTLLAYMEDNPASYNTVSLYAGFMSEFSAATNVVLNTIGKFNESVMSYNNHIQKFTNNMFLANKEPYATYSITNYNATLPTFN